MNTWAFTQIWNKSLEERKEMPTTPRDYIWASELGKSAIDIILRMRGETPTNPPNPRSLRKFEAGNIWEWVVKLILLRAGILQGNQKYCSWQYPGLLRVSGKLDFVAGGRPDYERSRAELNKLFLPEVFLRAVNKIIDYFEKEYPDGLRSKILEIKSVSGILFDKLERSQTCNRNHRLQLTHYLVANCMERGDIVYVSKDDCRMIEIGVFRQNSEEEYRAEIKKLTDWYGSRELPPAEKPIVFNEEFSRFEKNWHVAYSLYLTKVYGLENQKEFDDKYTPIAERWNRVLERAKNGKEMTDNNKRAIEEIENGGFDFDEIVKKIKG